MLRITINQSEQDAVIKLEGKVAGPWVAELSRTWKEQAPLLASRKLSLDLRDITYSDASGKQALREIYEQTGARLLTGTPMTRFLAEEVMRGAAHTNGSGQKDQEQ
jgi:anti-anti-sigma regulatory factor